MRSFLGDRNTFCTFFRSSTEDTSHSAWFFSSQPPVSSCHPYLSSSPRTNLFPCTHWTHDQRVWQKVFVVDCGIVEHGWWGKKIIEFLSLKPWQRTPSWSKLTHTQRRWKKRSDFNMLNTFRIVACLIILKIAIATEPPAGYSEMKGFCGQQCTP